MPNPTERFRHQMSQVVFVVILVSRLPPAGAGSTPPMTRNHKAPADKEWQVKYMDGPSRLKRGTPVQLGVTEQAISYRAVGSRPDQGFSIPVAGRDRRV